MEDKRDAKHTGNAESSKEGVIEIGDFAVAQVDSTSVLTEQRRPDARLQSDGHTQS